jgi:lipopolysaccharide biosynthesis protein
MNGEKIAVMVHVYFTDVLINKLIPKLKPLAEDADFYFNFVRGQETQEALDIIQNTFKHHTVSYTEQNVGRDVNGQLNNLKSLYSKLKRYDYYLFLHTKKSVHLKPEFGQAWMDNLTNIIKDKETIENVLHDFRTQPKLGMVCEPKCRVNLMTINQHNFDVFCKGFGMDPKGDFWFCAGTMFWVRAKIFDTFYSHPQIIPAIQGLFREENWAIDGEAHHAMERIYGKQVYSLGYYINIDQK